MDSNDENYESGDESNSMSTDTRNDLVSVKSERIQRKASNVVFVTPNELEDWESSENKKTKRTNKPRKSGPKTKLKTPISLKTKKRKNQTRKKTKKDNNPWSSDQEEDDDDLGLENEVSDDEYFRRLEESHDAMSDNQNTDQTPKLGENESFDEPDDYEDVQDDYYVKIFDSNNFELFNYISTSRDTTLDMDDKSKPIISFPESSNDLMCPNDKILQLLSIYETIIQYNILLKISPFKLEDFVAAMVINENSTLLSELHMSLLKLLIRDDEITNTQLCPPDQKDVVNFAFYLMDYMTWPELLRIYVGSLENKVSAVAISSNYPFVLLDERIEVLSFLIDHIIYCHTFREEISKEECIHEDFCRVCHEQGKVICCETCPAVYHFYCLTPKLPALPDTIWLCPICKRHQIDGLRDCNFDADKAIVEHKKTPLGNDRFGNTYWFVARRLIVEPRNDNIDNLLNDDSEEIVYHPDYNQVRYYSTWSSVEKLRSELSRDWEEELCSVFDGLVEEIRKSMQITLNLTVKGLQKVKNDMKESKVKSLLLIECSGEEKERILNAELSDLTSSSVNNDEEPVQNCVLKTISGQPVGLLEDCDGLLVRNIDSNAIRVRLSAKTISNQVDEVASRYNFNVKLLKNFNNNENSAIVYYRLGDEGDWRFYKNLYVTDANATSKLVHQEEKDKRRVLGNKFSINECNEFQWFVSKANNRSNWPSDKIPQKKSVNEYLGGPLSMLQCIRLTIQNMEAQIFAPFTCPSWRNDRKVWLINIQRTRNSANLAEFIANFESALRPCVFKKSWNSLLGFLELDRITVAEKEEDKKLKLQEKRANKNLELESTKTCNPGFLKHAIYKTKGEEYRRNGGDGWNWVSCTLLYNTMNLCLKPSPGVTGSKADESFKNLLINSEDMESDVLLKDFVSTKTNCSIDELLQNRENEINKYEKVSSLAESKNRLTQLQEKREEYLAKKKMLDEKLATLYSSLKSSNSSSSGVGRKRNFPFGNMSLQEKRARFGLTNDPISQYDGVDSDDDDADLDDDKYNDNSNSKSGSLVSNIPPPTVSSAQNTGIKPIVINNAGTASRVCLVNLPPGSQFQQGAMGNRLILNSNRLAAPMTTTTVSNTSISTGAQPRPNAQFIRLPTNMYIQPQTININPNMLATRPVLNTGTIRLQTDGTIARNNAGTAQVQPQFMYVNNIANISGGAPQIRFMNNLQVQQNSKQFQRLILPNMTDPNITGLPMRAAINANTTIAATQSQNVMKPNTTHAIRQRSTQALTNRVGPNVAAINFKQQEDYVKKLREIDDTANQLLELAYELDDLDQEINKMKFHCQQLNTESGDNHNTDPYELNQEPPKHCVAIINDICMDAKTKDEANIPIPPPKSTIKDSYQFKNPHNDDNKQPSCYSLFLHSPENLRTFFLSEGCIDIAGYETEKKRFNTVVWPYPSSRPNFNAVWRYQVARIMQSASVFEATPISNIKQEQSDSADENQPVLYTGATDSCLINPPDGNSTSNSGSFMSTTNNGIINGYGASGLAALALQLKMLWYSLRWDDMLTNWQDNEGVVSLVEIAQDTLPNGDILERRITKWRPLDDSYSRLQFLTTVCISSPSSSNVVPMNFLGTNSDNSSTFNITSNQSDDTSNKRSSKRARKKTVSMYTDSEYFTDDGEIDSDDSDPSFVPGMGGTNVRTPKSRAGRRRRGGAGNDDDGSGTMMMQQEKNYYSEWKFEDEIDMWEIRDYLMKTQWNRYHIQLPKLYLSDVMNGLVSKEIFTRPFEPVRSISTSVSPAIIQTLQRNQQNALQLPMSNTQFIRSTAQPVILNNQLQTVQAPISTPVMHTTVPTTTQLATALNTSITQPNPTIAVLEPKPAPLAPASETNSTSNSTKLIIESSGTIAPASTPSSTLAPITPKPPIPLTTTANSNVPAPLSDIRDTGIPRSNIAPSSNSIQQIPKSTLQIKSVPIKLQSNQPPSNLVPSNTPSSAGIVVQKSAGRGRGRGRGRPPLAKHPASTDIDIGPNMSSTNQVSSDDEDDADDGSFNKYEDLKVDIEESANDKIKRIESSKNEIQNQLVNEALLKADFYRQEEMVQKEKLQQQQPAQNIPPVQKIATPKTSKNSSSNNRQRMNSDDELTDPETESLKNKKLLKSPHSKSTPVKQAPINITPNNQLKRAPQLVSDIFDDDDEEVDSRERSPSLSTDDDKDSGLPPKQFKTIPTPQQPLVLPDSNKIEKKSKNKELNNSNAAKQAKMTSSTTNHSVTSNNALKNKMTASGLSPAKKRKKTVDSNNVQKENIKHKHSKHDSQLFCHCKKPYDEKKNYIGCDFCNNWYHFECVNMDHEKAGKITQYRCSNCLPKSNTASNAVTKAPSASISVNTTNTPSTNKNNSTKREAAQAKKPIIEKSDDEFDDDEEDEGNEYEEDENAVYCVCREKYNSHKMYIACDYCDEWYHPKCVGMTDSEANKIEGKYKCPRCRGIPDKPQNSKKSKTTKPSTNKSNAPNPSSINIGLAIDDNVKRRLFDLINKIFKHEDAISIIKNSKKDSRYQQIVKNPLDLSIVKSHLERDKYKNLGAFKLDIQKMFSGCSSYLDSTSDEYESVKNLEAIFMDELRHI